DYYCLIWHDNSGLF
nr:immunoglobulin light chain junction region [Macaca mulatta]MOX69803.1 immunoglobulin light chain junction region [Macaca mulatta]MOX69865.1 immunoglobulin light chain junction region [Macaca mulatta]MOX70067.1 immunoglobulin light chain junction region [Macaca mulatta]MOX70297.1 immunoglobulin light chain junction region [Macaca mulatta]